MPTISPVDGAVGAAGEVKAPSGEKATDIGPSPGATCSAGVNSDGDDGCLHTSRGHKCSEVTWIGGDNDVALSSQADHQRIDDVPGPGPGEQLAGSTSRRLIGRIDSGCRKESTEEGLSPPPAPDLGDHR